LGRIFGMGSRSCMLREWKRNLGECLGLVRLKSVNVSTVNTHPHDLAGLAAKMYDVEVPFGQSCI
jgi:hypothetical protein